MTTETKAIITKICSITEEEKQLLRTILEAADVPYRNTYYEERVSQIVEDLVKRGSWESEDI